MSYEYAYHKIPDLPRPHLHDLDEVALTVAITDDEGEPIPAGAEGTVVGVSEDGAAYLVEFREPEGAVVSVRRDEVRLTKPGIP